MSSIKEQIYTWIGVIMSFILVNNIYTIFIDHKGIGLINNQSNVVWIGLICQIIGNLLPNVIFAWRLNLGGQTARILWTTNAIFWVMLISDYELNPITGSLIIIYTLFTSALWTTYDTHFTK